MSKTRPQKAIFCFYTEILCKEREREGFIDYLLLDFQKGEKLYKYICQMT